MSVEIVGVGVELIGSCFLSRAVVRLRGSDKHSLEIYRTVL